MRMDLKLLLSVVLAVAIISDVAQGQGRFGIRDGGRGPDDEGGRTGLRAEDHVAGARKPRDLGDADVAPNGDGEEGKRKQATGVASYIYWTLKWSFGSSTIHKDLSAATTGRQSDIGKCCRKFKSCLLLVVTFQYT
ncbi:uncharacterized protein LOC118422409 isoform X1 [Branchiostoma floridae]|uniref:Uncharacterized protein LOC118422409 isoform X1 n=1 Tax=Branchiostoma floridae TaxID=7739 RepID=A0A9J7LPS3_BRAFL|nr:uncharacterized protein LOC118422409 isoform X1 [Branchiostoma floridae]